MPLDACKTRQYIVTNEPVPTEIRSDILSTLRKGEEKYVTFRRGCARISSIHHTNFKSMSSAQSKGQPNAKKVVKENNIVGRAMESHSHHD